ncbi:ATP-binding-cassette protein [Striga asiatica]|uniref:ATP-binding-cassette protein n=1 Tax=Striga asiatica TaxID=4170 RepID=A0A5A7PW62_STRAF|nr:ATP-binding-cassette protein [Striga asiatica]
MSPATEGNCEELRENYIKIVHHHNVSSSTVIHPNTAVTDPRDLRTIFLPRSMSFSSPRCQRSPTQANHQTPRVRSLIMVNEAPNPPLIAPKASSSTDRSTRLITPIKLSPGSKNSQDQGLAF